MFSEKTHAWLADRGLADDGVRYRRVIHAAGNVALSGADAAALLPYPESVCAVIDGDLSVDGELLVDDMHALVVKGRVKCRSFWVGEGRFRAAELDVSDVCTFACYADDMRFEVDRVSTALLCTRKGETPSGVAIEAKHTIDAASLEHEKLLGWILDDAFATVLAALDAGTTIDDAWCASHEDLVTNVERRAMLVEASVPPRVRKILEDIAAGATIGDTEVGGRPAVCVVLADGSKRIAVLTPDERAALARRTTPRHG